MAFAGQPACFIRVSIRNEADRWSAIPFGRAFTGALPRSGMRQSFGLAIQLAALSCSRCSNPAFPDSQPGPFGERALPRKATPRLDLVGRVGMFGA
jgi:hypothetical protein